MRPGFSAPGAANRTSFMPLFLCSLILGRRVDPPKGTPSAPAPRLSSRGVCSGPGPRCPGLGALHPGYAQAGELPQRCRTATTLAGTRALVATGAPAGQASEEVDHQIDANAQEGSHGTRQCHDQKGLVDHTTTPPDGHAPSRNSPQAPSSADRSPSDPSDPRIGQKPQKCTPFAALALTSDFGVAALPGGDGPVRRGRDRHRP